MSTGATHPGTIRRVFRIVSPTCEEMSALISAMLDEQLPLATRLRMRLHFLYCCYCRRVREHLAFVRRSSALLESSAAVLPEDGIEVGETERLRGFLQRRE